MWNARLDESQAGVKIARRNLNNRRYADDTTLMAESEEEIEPLEGEREQQKSWLKTQHWTNEDHGIWSITSWQREGEKMDTATDFILLVSKIAADSDYSHEIKRCLLIGRKLWQT